MEKTQAEKKFTNSPEYVVQESIAGLGIVMNNCIDLVYQDGVNTEEIPIVSIKLNSL